jgi:hypothetical protein
MRYEKEEDEIGTLRHIEGLASNKSLERTADRREDLLSMTSILNPEAQRALVSGRSSCSR